MGEWEYDSSFAKTKVGEWGIVYPFAHTFRVSTYALDRMNIDAESSKSMMALDHNLVREDPSESVEPSSSARQSHFASLSYSTEGVASTLSVNRLNDLQEIFQIPPQDRLRVPNLDQWACSYNPSKASF